jgi:hypothetical protein
MRRVEKELPPPGRLTRLCLRYPFPLLVALTLLPHVLGSVVNITYNALYIEMTDPQEAWFVRLLVGYNAVVYPVCVGLCIGLIVPLHRTWRRLRAGEPVAGAEAAAARRRALRLPLQVVALSCVGWLPGGLLFPLGMHLLSERMAPAAFGHFLVSFTVSGLIALTYSYFAVQFVVLRVLYPQLWTDAADLRTAARQELGSLDGRLRFFQFLAGLIPLAGAVLLVGVAPKEFTLSFRLLVTALIALGMAGFGVALLVSSRLGRTLAVLTAGRAG